MTKSVVSSGEGKRLHELDILRATAVILVLGRHLLEIPDTLPSGLRISFLIWREMGWIGVDLFFVLSGYLVSGLLFREYQSSQGIRMTRFLVRRGLKIYPPFYFFLAVTFLLSDYLPLPHEQQRYFGELLFLQNYVGSVWNHTWSLAVEEHFYLLLASVIFLLARTNHYATNPFRFLPPLFLAIMALVLVLRCIVGRIYTVGEWAPLVVHTHFRIDSLLAGVLLAYYCHYQRHIVKLTIHRLGHLLVWVALCLVIVPALTPLSHSRFSYTLGFTFLYLGFGAIIMLMLLSQSKLKVWAVRVSAPFLAPIGRASYSIYLWHMFVYYLTGFLIEDAQQTTVQFVLRVSAYFAGSISLGVVMFRLIEIPSRTLRERLYPIECKTQPQNPETFAVRSSDIQYF